MHPASTRSWCRTRMARPSPPASELGGQRPLDCLHYVLVRGDVVPAVGDRAVLANEEYPWFAGGVVPQDPVGSGLVHHLVLEVTPDFDVDEVDAVAVRLLQIDGHVRDRPAEAADAVHGRGDDDEQ